jgi:NAD(P)-dependent dehydrogenase (short-subunit alcohol dehydrogenase family)
MASMRTRLRRYIATETTATAGGARTATTAREDGTVRTIVVGASSGLGRCIGRGLAARGARVALLARRKSQLEEAAREAGPDALAIACDVTDEDECRTAIDAAADGLGGIDALVYAAGIGPLARIEDLDASTWRRAFDTNVTGAALVTSAALSYLQQSRGRAVYLSSVSASMTPPWPGLAAYVVSKAALDKLVDAWRAEHPEVGFTRLTIGDCIGGDGDSLTQFADAWDTELAAELGAEWVARNYLAGALIDVEHLVGIVDAVLRGGASLSLAAVTVTPRPV